MWKQYRKLYEVALSKSRATEDKLMCDTLNKLKGKSAEQILLLAGQENAAPVDMDKVFAVLGLQKTASDFSEIEKMEGKGKISGIVLLDGNDVRIFFNKNDGLEQKRFTAAHEIGHCCLHGDDLKTYNVEFLHKDGFENEHEKAASMFAARLLVPKASLLSVYGRLLKPTLKGLSEIFQVPEKIMEIRLKEENLKA